MSNDRVDFVIVVIGIVVITIVVFGIMVFGILLFSVGIDIRQGRLIHDNYNTD